MGIIPVHFVAIRGVNLASLRYSADSTLPLSGFPDRKCTDQRDDGTDDVVHCLRLDPDAFDHNLRPRTSFVVAGLVWIRLNPETLSFTTTRR